MAIWSLPLPFLMNTAGWVLTENGRQPWIVQGLQQTRDAASPSVGTATIVTSLAIFVLLYGALAVVDWMLMARFAGDAVDPTGAARPARNRGGPRRRGPGVGRTSAPAARAVARGCCAG